MSEIQAAKAKLTNLRADFEARKAQEWAEIQARAQVALDDAVWRARHEQGLSVYAIAKEYGTTNRNTIYSILTRAREFHNLVQPATSDVYTAERDPNNAAHWLLTSHALGSTVVVEPATHKVRKNDPNREAAAWWLANVHNNPEHEAWEVTK